MTFQFLLFFVFAVWTINSIADCSVCRYGADAAKFADHTLYATGNLAMTGYNVNHLGVKAIAKRAAKDTGKAVLLDHKRSKEDLSKSKASATSASEKPQGSDKARPGGKH